MPLILTDGPSVEPVSLAEAKLHCRVDGDAEDTLISSLIIAARMHIERSLNIALVEQSWSLFLDRWPDRSWLALPLTPVASLDAVRLYSPSDTFMALGADLFQLDDAGLRPRLSRREAQAWPLPGRSVNGIEIAFTAGYGPTADDVPMPIRLAIRMLVAHWYENREPVLPGEAVGAAVPLGVASLISPYREVRL
jgi:uncharacterized phiE125 gp8 family phage protein